MVEIHGDVYFKYMEERSFIYKLFSRITKFTLKRATKIRSLSNSMNDMLKKFGFGSEYC